MVQLVGGVTADQVKPMTLEEEAVAVSPPGAEGTAEQLLAVLIASMPLMNGLSALPSKSCTMIWPYISALAVNCLTSALSAPANAYTSKLARTRVPLILTLKMRFPAAVQ